MSEITADKKQVYRVDGFSCANCAAKFESNVKSLTNVEDARVNFGASKITVIGEASVEELEKAGAFEGLKVYPEKGSPILERKPFWLRKQTYVMLASFVLLLAGFVMGEQTIAGKILFALSIVTGGSALFVRGFRGLVKLNFSMNSLMTIAIVGAALIGEWREGAVVVILFAISEALESYSMDKARHSIRSLMQTAPKEATIRREEQEMVVPVERIRVGDVMIVKPGQKLAMDGQVVNGESSINQAAITGESIPVLKQAGDEVFAGTLNGEGLLEVRVTKPSEDTTIAKIIHLVEEAQAEKAPSQAFVDKFAKYYTPGIMALALLVAIVPPVFMEANWGDWIYNALALLVVGCPCALVISTPVAIVTAIGTAARNGVLIKGGIHLEETGKIKTLAFDKTGTLTSGQPVITDLIRISGPSAEHWLGIAASIERSSQHPLASAILNKAEELQTEANEWRAEGFLSITGRGAKAQVNGEYYWIGSPALFEEMYDIPDDVKRTIGELQGQGKTVMVLGTEHEVLALFAARDEVRENSKEMIRQLHAAGVEHTVMLTGDNRLTAEAIGAALGIREVRAELMPEEKRAAIRELEQHGKHTAMVGDGVNDAPALASATVGIAMGGAGTDAALETADIALMGDDLSKLPFVIRLSRRTLRIIKQNIAFSLLVKAAAITLIGPGWLTLWLAIFADMGATLIVTLNALRLLRVRE